MSEATITTSSINSVRTLGIFILMVKVRELRELRGTNEHHGPNTLFNLKFPFNSKENI
ncbi:hypothetical protein LL1119B1_08200 [Lactococcus lactis]|nr:hypothetical protein LL1119B1_08200 [Lactococcus lactis]